LQISNFIKIRAAFLESITCSQTDWGSQQVGAVLSFFVTITPKDSYEFISCMAVEALIKFTTIFNIKLIAQLSL
jgi:hypothetical protein